MSRNVIVDGFTRTLRINKTDLNDEMDGKYRPALPEEVRKHDAEVEAVDDTIEGGSAMITAEFIDAHLITWSEVDEAGQPLPVTIENVRRLGPLMLGRVRNIICGFTPNDVKPEASEQSSQDRIAAIKAKMNPPEETELQQQQGNSDAA